AATWVGPGPARSLPAVRRRVVPIARAAAVIAAIRTEEARSLAFAHVDVDVDPVGLALIGGVVLAQVQRGRVVVAVATVLGIADAGGETAGHLDLVVGDVGDLRVVVHARAA